MALTAAPDPQHVRSAGSVRALLAAAALVWATTALWFATQEVTTYDSAYSVLRWGQWIDWTTETLKPTMQLRALITLLLAALGTRDLYRCLRQQAARLPLHPDRWLAITTVVCGLVMLADLGVRDV